MERRQPHEDGAKRDRRSIDGAKRDRRSIDGAKRDEVILIGSHGLAIQEPQLVDDEQLYEHKQPQHQQAQHQQAQHQQAQRAQHPQQAQAHDAKLKEHRRMLARAYITQEEEKQKQLGEQFYRCERCGI